MNASINLYAIIDPTDGRFDEFTEMLARITSREFVVSSVYRFTSDGRPSIISIYSCDGHYVIDGYYRIMVSPGDGLETRCFQCVQPEVFLEFSRLASQAGLLKV